MYGGKIKTKYEEKTALVKNSTARGTLAKSSLLARRTREGFGKLDYPAERFTREEDNETKTKEKAVRTPYGLPLSNSRTYR